GRGGEAGARGPEGEGEPGGIGVVPEPDLNVVEVGGPRLGGEGENPVAGGLEAVQARGPGREAGEGNAQGVAHGDADGLAVEGVGAPGGEEDAGAGADQGRGVAEHGSEIVVVDQVLQDEQDPGPGGELVGGRPAAPEADGEEAPVDVEADDAVHQRLVGEVDRGL